MHKVFVYGTLRRGESNHHWLGDTQYLGEMRTEPEFLLYDLGAYPAMIPCHQNGIGFRVVGEVFCVDDEGLCKLDQLEEAPIVYRREVINTPYGKAWVYLYQDEASLSKPIVSGDWCCRE